ncbi:hypothetical protein [Lactobacillus bombicola]|uniref:Uncharacterized protein n=1 Tax=Lactobacillus bombicola TaxID=1505723 RepID=A0ABX9LX97_9LACO|nr:hypothetical protein [Lactobacillus bombicola]RHW49183.1 hypothetical protein DS833_05655 [Lactobacillus bombicola]RHW53675.1 hypothetical protein DS834_01110 [Lactobacillus bombicola]
MNAFSKLKDIAPKLWTDKVTIKTTKKVVTEHHITTSEPVTIVSDEPAKVILKGLKSGEQSFFGTDEYDATLLIRTGLDIPAGATIEVTDINGKVTKYKRSSKGYSGYVSHQEVAMTRDEKA